MYWETQWNIIQHSNTQCGSFYLWHKTVRYLEELTYRTCWKRHPTLQTGAARLDVGRAWLFFSGHSVLRAKGKYRRLQLCFTVALHFMCFSELRNEGTEVKHGKLDCWKTTVGSQFESWSGLLSWSTKGLWSTSSVICIFVLCSIKPVWVSWWRAVW